jgi:hypothetical protein
MMSSTRFSFMLVGILRGIFSSAVNCFVSPDVTGALIA